MSRGWFGTDSSKDDEATVIVPEYIYDLLQYYAEMEDADKYRYSFRKYMDRLYEMEEDDNNEFTYWLFSQPDFVTKAYNIMNNNFRGVPDKEKEESTRMIADDLPLHLVFKESKYTEPPYFGYVYVDKETRELIPTDRDHATNITPELARYLIQQKEYSSKLIQVHNI